MSKPKEIRAVAQSFIDIDGSILSTIEMLQSYLDKHGPTAQIEVESYDDYGSPTTDIRITVIRMETPAEVAKRDTADA